MFPVVIQAVVDEGDGERPFSVPLPSGLWTVLTSVCREFIPEVMKDIGSAHLAHSGPWGLSPKLSVSGLGCRALSSAPSDSGIASCLAPAAETAASQASDSGVHARQHDRKQRRGHGAGRSRAVGCQHGRLTWEHGSAESWLLSRVRMFLCAEPAGGTLR